MKKIKDNSREPFFVCIGMPTHPHDSIGPRIGSLLAKHGYKAIGEMDFPVHALNLKEWADFIRTIDTNKYQVIAIDAVLTKHDYLCATRPTPCRPGAGMKKILPEIGEASIVVNPFYFKPKLKFWKKKLLFYFGAGVSEPMLDLLAKTVFNEIRVAWSKE
jgi:putative sporulation protein YyaC